MLVFISHWNTGQCNKYCVFPFENKELIHSMLDVLWADSPQLSPLEWSQFKKDSSPTVMPSSCGSLHPMIQEYKGSTCYPDLGQPFQVSQGVGWGLHSYCTIAHLLPLFNLASFPSLPQVLTPNKFPTYKSPSSSLFLRNPACNM